MAWIELHQTLPRHPKLIRLASRLRVPRAQAAGHLTFLWLWTLDYAPTGDLSAFGPAEISAAADFGGDAELFAKALLETGWLTGDMQVHDWEDYAGRLIDDRIKSKERMREFRQRQREENERKRSSVLQERSANVRVTCPERAELPNPTQPNTTQHNTTQHNTTQPNPTVPLLSISPPMTPPARDGIEEEIYQAYPRKVAKQDAIKAIRKAMKDVEPVKLLEITKAYASARVGADPQFTPHPATWFNGRRYNDDPGTWNTQPRANGYHDNTGGKAEWLAQSARQLTGEDDCPVR